MEPGACAGCGAGDPSAADGLFNRLKSSCKSAMMAQRSAHTLRTADAVGGDWCSSAKAIKCKRRSSVPLVRLDESLSCE